VISVTSEQLAVSSKPVATNNEPPVTIPPITNPQSPIPNPAMGKLRSTATIGKPIIQQVAQSISQVQEPGIQQNKPFTINELQPIWDKLITDLEKRRRFSEYVILNRKFTLNGTTIHLEVDNEIQIDLLTTTLRTEVLNFLRRELQNSTIHLEIVVAEQENTTLIYTQADKFKFLAEKNPALHELRSVLGLDYDY
jgi:DNA polymerase III subunit gamma/tau